MLFESFLDFFFEDPTASRSDLWFIRLKSIPVWCFFVEKWSFSLQDHIFMVFFGFLEDCLS